MKRPMGSALWCDCETDEERAVFFRSGRAYDTGVIAKDLAEPLALAFEDAAKWRQMVSDFVVKIDVENRRFGIEQKHTPPWGLDAVPLMACPKNNKTLCRGCGHEHPHEHLFVCDQDQDWSTCPHCVQVGWRERSKP